MSVELQRVKRGSHLAEWTEMVRQCRNSGMTVKAWCGEQGLNEKTYYHRQKQVCNALPEGIGQTVRFAEVSGPAIRVPSGNAVHIRIGAADISVDGNTDLELLRNILRIAAETC